MPIEDVFSISGRGTVVTGRVERGIVKVGEEVEIVGLKATAKTMVTGVEMFRKLLDQGEAGDNIGALLRGIEARGRRARPGSGQAGLDHAAHEVQGRGLHPDEGGGRPSHAVLHQLPSAVLLPHDGRDGRGEAAGGHRDGDAGRQRDDGGRADRADRHGRGPALRHPRGRPHRRRRRRRQDRRSNGNGSATAGRHDHGQHRISASGSRPSIIACSTQSTSEIVSTAKRTGAQVRGPIPLPTRHREVHGQPLAAHRQEVARAVRDPHPQAPARHRRPDAADRGRADEARPRRRRRRRDQARRLRARREGTGPCVPVSSPRRSA